MVAVEAIEDCQTQRGVVGERGAALREPADPGGGGITINFPAVDWTTLILNLVGLFFDAVGTFVMNVPGGVWSSSANVVGQTDLRIT